MVADVGCSLTRASAEHPAHLCLQPVDQRGNTKRNKLNSLFCLSSPSRLEVTGKGQVGALLKQKNSFSFFCFEAAFWSTD